MPTVEVKKFNNSAVTMECPICKGRIVRDRQAFIAHMVNVHDAYEETFTDSNWYLSYPHPISSLDSPWLNENRHIKYPIMCYGCRASFIDAISLLTHVNDTHISGGAVAMGIIFPGVYNVTTYGALGDGVTDDTTAIQLAITAAYDNGGTVYFPPGSYLVTTTLNITTLSPLLILGYGAKLELADGVTGFNITQALSSILGVVIEGFEIDGNDGAITTGVQFCNTVRAKVLNCYIHDCTIGVALKAITTDSTLGTGEQDVWVESCQLENVLIKNCTTGVDFIPATWDNSMNTSFGQMRMDSVDISGCATGIFIRRYASVYRSTFTKVTCWQVINDSIGFRVAGQMEHNIIELSCEKSVSGATGTIGIQIDATATLLNRNILHYSNYSIDTPISNASTAAAFNTDLKPMALPMIRAAITATIAATTPNYAALVQYQNQIGVLPMTHYMVPGGLVRVTITAQGNQAGAKTMRVQDITNNVTICSKSWTGNTVGRRTSDWVIIPEIDADNATLELQFSTETAGETISVHDAWLQFK